MAVTQNPPHNGFLIQNLYGGEDLPKFWTREIERVDENKSGLIEALIQ
jgi:hypothetical protein